MTERPGSTNGIDTGALAAGLAFVVFGVGFLLEALDVWDLQPEYVWPALLIVFGAAILAGGRSIHRSD